MHAIFPPFITNIPQAWEFEPLFYEGMVDAKQSHTHGGIQCLLNSSTPLYHRYVETIKQAVNPWLVSFGVLGDPIQGWTIQYAPGGYQSVHTHGSGVCSTILCMSDIDEYTLMGTGIRGVDRIGQLRVFDSNVPHSSVPVSVVRKIIVLDFRFRRM